MKRARLSRDDLTQLAANRPPRRVHRDAPDLPVHYEGFTAPTPCGVPVAAWAARTRRPDLVTCPVCAANIAPPAPLGAWVEVLPVDDWPSGKMLIVDVGAWRRICGRPPAAAVTD